MVPFTRCLPLDLHTSCNQRRNEFSIVIKFDGKLVWVGFHCRVSYRYRILHMPRQHSCRAMCKMSLRSLHYSLDESRIKFPLNLNYDAFQILSLGVHSDSETRYVIWAHNFNHVSTFFYVILNQVTDTQTHNSVSKTKCCEPDYISQHSCFSTLNAPSSSSLCLMLLYAS